MRTSLRNADTRRDNLKRTAADREFLVQAGSFLTSMDEIRDLVVGVHWGRPVYLRDVARIEEGPDTPRNYVWTAPGPAAVQAKPALHAASPTVTIAVAKKPGENAVDIANRVIKRFKQLQGTYKLDGVEVAITRDYGAIADAKAKKLIIKLGFFPSITDRSDAQRS